MKRSSLDFQISPAVRIRSCGRTKVGYHNSINWDQHMNRISEHTDASGRLCYVLFKKGFSFFSRRM